MRQYPTRRRRAPEGITPQLGNGFVVRRELDSPDGPLPFVVSGETGVYVIERRAGADFEKLIRQAKWLGDQLDEWVTPVVCVDGVEPHNVGLVAVVSHDALVDWLNAQPPKSATPPRFAARITHAA